MRILVISNIGSGLYKFRKELLQELINRNNDIYISLPHDEYVSKLIELGCKCIETHLDRRGTNVVRDLKLLLCYIKIIRQVKPEIVLTYTIKPNVYGGLACRITNTPYLTNVTGLGTVIENAGLMQKVGLVLYKMGLKNSKCVFFQNEQNRQLFIKRNIARGKTRLIPGSGVNLKQHNMEEYPSIDKVIRFLYLGRIMKAKGIDELLEAARIVKEKYLDVQFDLVGSLEEDYSEILNTDVNDGSINYHVEQENIRHFLKNSHATILPSYHEGTSNVLLESAATGRPILASKVPGCMETFDDGISGLGFEAKNVKSIVDAILTFIELPYDQKRQMGIAGRKKMEREYDRRIVVDAYIEEINN